MGSAYPGRPASGIACSWSARFASRSGCTWPRTGTLSMRSDTGQCRSRLGCRTSHSRTQSLLPASRPVMNNTIRIEIGWGACLADLWPVRVGVFILEFVVIVELDGVPQTHCSGVHKGCQPAYQKLGNRCQVSDWLVLGLGLTRQQLQESGGDEVGVRALPTTCWATN